MKILLSDLFNILENADISVFIIMIVFLIAGMTTKSKSTVIILGILTVICEIFFQIETPRFLAGEGVAVIQMWTLLIELAILPAFTGSLISLVYKRLKKK